MKDNAFIHLCQPDEYKSCAACCGLYNYADSTKESLVKRLRNRTEVFRNIVKCPGDIEHFSEIMRMSEDQEKRYEVIYCCEYVGFLDETETKVGCLLHPCCNNGSDLRGVSFYGGDLCGGHLCPSYQHLSREEKLALITITDDWYLYGLCVTDIDFVKLYFRMVSERVCEMPLPEIFKESHVRDIALRFFSFKISWPFRSPAVNRFGKYYFDGSEYMISRINYKALGCAESRFNGIFLSLSSEFENIEELKAGEDMIQRNIDELAGVYSRYR